MALSKKVQKLIFFFLNKEQEQSSQNNEQRLSSLKKLSGVSYLKGDLAMRSSLILMSTKCSPTSNAVKVADTILSMILRDNLIGKLEPDGAETISQIDFGRKNYNYDW